ncbi:hypothetical protein XA68_16046 [Ophiocordyceps unilateralis]|uniref:Translation initiation factor eIF2B subunit gamma n=1 Tax=Ophiocordyceps unilateralis TaxID=268505 RepID=A0A2A9P6D3_OPHUN|nr:hypothetical protein XA68_16046 [Ophiocordyceps unilateralis]
MAAISNQLSADDVQAEGVEPNRPPREDPPINHQPRPSPPRHVKAAPPGKCGSGAQASSLPYLATQPRRGSTSGKFSPFSSAIIVKAPFSRETFNSPVTISPGMPHAVSMPATGLQALILCGPGSSLATFTSDPDENLKALIPIANRPMVWYPIDFCLRMGVTAITLICPPSASSALTTAFNINPFLTGLPLPRPDILAPAGLDQNTGTADILRMPQVRELVNTDFIVLPCDLVCELAGEQLLQAWMVKSASLAEILGVSSFSNGGQTRHSGGLGVWFNTKTTSTTRVKGEETDLIGTAPLPCSPTAAPKNSVFQSLSKLVYSIPTDSLNDITEEQNALPIRKSLLRKHPNVRMYATLRDAHIYIFPRWVLDFVQANDRLQSIGEDVVGWLAKAGWQRGLAEKLHLDTLLSDRPAGDDSSSTSQSANTPREASPTNEGRPKRWSLVRTVTAEVRQAQEKRDGSKDCQVPPVVAYVHPSEGPQSTLLIRRVDTPQLLLATSLQLAKLPSTEESGAEGSSPFAHVRKIAYPEGVKARTTITKQDSLIGDNVTVEEKTSIKETVVGANCQIQQGAKLWQCLLMEGVVIGKGCKLSKCILGRRCVIGEGSVLTDCEVQDNLLVEAGTEDKENKLMSSNLEATAAEVDEVLQEEGEEIAAATDEGGPLGRRLRQS